MVYFAVVGHAYDRRGLLGRLERHRRARVGGPRQRPRHHATRQDQCDVTGQLHVRHAAGYQRSQVLGFTPDTLRGH